MRDRLPRPGLYAVAHVAPAGPALVPALRSAPAHGPRCPHPEVAGPWLLCPWCGADLYPRPAAPPPPPPALAAPPPPRAAAPAAAYVPHGGRYILCITCGADGVPDAGQQRCAPCYQYRYRTGRERPPAVYAPAPAPRCRICGERQIRPLSRGRCPRCYGRWRAARRPIPRSRALVLVRDG